MPYSSLTNGTYNPTEIAFFDLETTVPKKPGQKFCILEFGAIVVCPQKLIELESYCTLIRPQDLSVVAVKPGRSHGITRDAVAVAPPLEEVADKIFGILDGRIWAGHNIQRFDCVRIREAFAEINRPAPVAAGIIDSLGVLSQKFGKRAGNMKMATLADYFDLGQQKHRSLEDCRMNLEVLKHCATVLLLESSLPPTLLNGQWHGSSSSITTRSKSIQRKSSPIVVGDASKDKLSPNRGKSGNMREETSRKSPPASTSAAHQRAVPYARESLRKVTARMKNFLCSTSTQQLNNVLKNLL